MASEYLKWKYRNVQPDAPVEQTKKQRRRNWWHYHKWYVVLGAAAVLMAGNLVWHAATQVRPDYQIAYVGGVPLPDTETAAWEDRLSTLGTDCNGDGKVIIKINQYVTPQNTDDALYAYASNVKLMADLDSCESYFFLLEDPEAFQAGYEVLQEDWVPLESGLFLARRDFWEGRTPTNLEHCVQLWDALRKEERS